MTKTYSIYFYISINIPKKGSEKVNKVHRHTKAKFGKTRGLPNNIPLSKTCDK